MPTRSKSLNGLALPKSDKQILGHVYLIEDNADIRRHLTVMLDRFGLIVNGYETAEAFLAQETLAAPGVVLLDMALPGANGISAFNVMKQREWTTPVVFVSGQSEPTEIIDAMRMGADNFLWKPIAADKLIDAVKKAIALDKEQMRERNRQQNKQDRWDMLTEREKQICKLVINGFQNSQIARQLDVMPDTIKKHRARILEKVSVKSVPDLVNLFRDFDFGA